MSLQFHPKPRSKVGRPSNINGPPILKFKGLKGTNNININIVSIADKVCEMFLVLWRFYDLY